MSDIQTLRVEVATTTASAYGAMRTYAEALNNWLPAFWYEVEANDTGDTAAIVHVEKKALYAELKKVQHSNPSVVWARVRKYGKEAVEAVESENGDEESADTNEGASPNRSLRLRFVEELTKLYKAGRREGPALEGDLKDAHTYIASALAELGVDLTKA